MVSEALGGAFLLFVAASAQYGDYKPPVPQCRPFICPAGAKPIRKKGYKAWSYGCKDTGMNFMSMSPNYDPNDPLGSLRNNQKSFDKCCLENDACLQTCGMTSQECHNLYQKCVDRVCKGDKNCGFQGQMAQIMNQPYDEERYDLTKSKDEKTDPMCRTYDKLQAESCECVAKDEWEDVLTQRIKTFYKLYNPEKLNAQGDIKDLDQVKTKWKGKFSEMFLELTKKYKDKAIERKVKPAYKPPAKAGVDDESYSDLYGSEVGSAEGSFPSSDEDVGSEIDESSLSFESQLKTLEKSKKIAKEQEDYDKASELVEAIKDLKKTEISRLRKEKAEAIVAEDYKKAKLLKMKLEELEPKQEL